MKNRPWPIVVLAVVQLLMPVFSTILNAWLLDTTPLTYARVYIEHKPLWSIFEFFLFYPLAGLAIFLMKKWSYPVFLFVTGWTFASNWIIWFRDYQGSTSPWILALANGANLFFVTYYLLPAVRKVYFDKALRWWESKPRFLIEFDAHVADESGPSHPCKIRDISSGGCFFESTRNLNTGGVVTISINILGRSLDIKSKIVHKRNGSVSGYGVQFSDTKEALVKIENLIQLLSSMGFELRWARESTWKSFQSWCKNIFNKEGWLPTSSK